jgi:putative ABC transport system permease protein
MNTLAIAIKNLRRKKIRSVLTIGGVSIAVAVLVSLMGFDKGYQQSLTSNIDRMGYQLLVTAKGCPYEAATMMLKGGGGLRYMEQDAYEQIRSDDRIEQITPQLVATVFDPDRAEGQGGFVMFMGIHESYMKLKPWNKTRLSWALKRLNWNSAASVMRFSSPAKTRFSKSPASSTAPAPRTTVSSLCRCKRLSASSNCPEN